MHYARTIEIAGRFIRERHRFVGDDSTTIIGTAHTDEGETVTVKGPVVGSLVQGLPYRFQGRWTSYRNKRTGQDETQFAFVSYVGDAPSSRDGIVAYLVHHGVDHGMSRTRAGKLFDRFATDTVRVCREQPELIAETINNWKPEKIEALAKELLRVSATEKSEIELAQILDRSGLPKATARRAIEKWGNRAAAIVKHDPYKLIGFPRCGFKLADKLYHKLGLPLGRLKRQARCAAFVVQEYADGSTIVSVDTVAREMAKLIPDDENKKNAINTPRAFRLAKRARLLAFPRTEGNRIVTTGGKLWVSSAVDAAREEAIAIRIAAARDAKNQWPIVDEIEQISEHQRDQLRLALAGPIGCFGGSPGTGKTYTVAALIKQIIATYGANRIAIAAPTGKAAARLSDVLKSYGLDIKARTLASLLWSSQLSGEPLEQSFIVVDEASMVDLETAQLLFSSTTAESHVLLVGDTNQLPPVGCGAPLRDLIESEVPYGELKEIRRNSGLIVTACHAIRDGKHWEPAAKENLEAGDNLILIKADSPDKQIAEMLRKIREIRSRGYDPIWDVQVLATVNEKSQVARQKLNAILQNELTPGRSSASFRLGDKVVNTVNTDYKLATAQFDFASLIGLTDDQGTPADSVRVTNGDIGKVVAIESDHYKIKLLVGGDVVKVPRSVRPVKPVDQEEDGEGSGGENEKSSSDCQWDLAYALSIHKGQGSEFPFVLMMLDNSGAAMRLASRELLYTGISRAKTACYLIGELPTARRMTQRVALAGRKTLLKERINRALCRQLADTI